MSPQDTLAPARLGALSDSQLEELRTAVRMELLHRRGRTLRCKQCETAFYARSNARFCSSRCRVASFRMEHAQLKEKQ